MTAPRFIVAFVILWWVLLPIEVWLVALHAWEWLTIALAAFLGGSAFGALRATLYVLSDWHQMWDDIR